LIGGGGLFKYQITLAATAPEPPAAANRNRSSSHRQECSHSAQK